MPSWGSWKDYAFKNKGPGVTAMTSPRTVSMLLKIVSCRMRKRRKLKKNNRRRMVMVRKDMQKTGDLDHYLIWALQLILFVSL